MGENKYTSEDLKIMQSWPLEKKIQVTQTRIIEWYLKNNGNVYVSFSGGKDSTVLLDLARRIFPDIPAVFIDTGLEYPELREFVKTIPNVTWLKPKMNFRRVIEKYGYPLISKEVSNKIQGAKPNNIRWQQLHGIYINPKTGKCSTYYNFQKYEYLLKANFKISDKCCNIMKKLPVLEYEKLSGRKPILGLMACESRKRKLDYLKTGCNAFDKKRSQSQPMGFWTEQDVLMYISKILNPYIESQWHNVSNAHGSIRKKARKELRRLNYRKIGIASIYGDIVKDKNGKLKTTGCNRTGCVFCGFGCHLEKEPNRFQKLAITHPKLWNYCMKPWSEGGLGMREVLEYIGVNVDNNSEGLLRNE